MKQTINFSDFCDTLKRMNRDNNFTYEGKRALFDYLEELENDTDMEIELDVIALCCDFTEYENLAELQDNYTDIESMDDLYSKTVVINIDGTEGFIIENY